MTNFFSNDSGLTNCSDGLSDLDASGRTSNAEKAVVDGEPSAALTSEPPSNIAAAVALPCLNADEIASRLLEAPFVPKACTKLHVVILAVHSASENNCFLFIVSIA
mmetsp:Transcript_10221/g.15234  ORF Transcript_10221/g.15234 Transcript_10221/m.15234 type:complete len:106 (+) Transcript_10221:1243-1560(+)